MQNENTATRDKGPLIATLEGREIRLSGTALRRHTVALGSPGTGKTTLMLQLLAHKLRRKANGLDHDAIVVLDPHGDLVTSTLQLLHPESAGQVRLLDLGGRDRVPGINLLDPHLFFPQGGWADVLTNTVISDGREEWGPAATHLLRQALRTAHQFNAHPNTRSNERLTILDIPALLQDTRPGGRTCRSARTMSGLQHYVHARTGNRELREWFKSLMGWDRETLQNNTGTINAKLEAYAADHRASIVLGQQETSTGELDEALLAGQVLLVSLSQGRVGAGPAALVGTAIARMLQDALTRQKELPEQRRNPCLLVCEEFPTLSQVDWARLLELGGRHGLQLALTAQSLQGEGTRREKLREAVLERAGTIVAFRTTSGDAQALALRIDPRGAAEQELPALQHRRCYVHDLDRRVRHPGVPARAEPPPKPQGDQEETGNTVQLNSREWTTGLDEARERLDRRARRLAEIQQGVFRERKNPGGTP